MIVYAEGCAYLAVLLVRIIPKKWFLKGIGMGYAGKCRKIFVVWVASVVWKRINWSGC